MVTGMPLGSSADHCGILINNHQIMEHMVAVIALVDSRIVHTVHGGTVGDGLRHLVAVNGGLYY